MPVTTKHPAWSAAKPDWDLMADSLEGERAIKARGTLYLPKTSGMVAAESGEGAITAEEARELYDGFKGRADYPLWVKDSLRAMIGLASRQEPEIQLPRQLESLREMATADGFGLKALWLRVIIAELTKGRCPLLGDWDDDGQPYIAEYSAESAINWLESAQVGRRDLSLVVFAETRTSATADEYSHDTDDVYRVLDMDEGRARVRILDEAGAEIEEEETIGRQSGTNLEALDFLPVVIIGPTDNGPDVDEIPLLTMAKAALKYYQLSADYYTSLNYTAHPQPVVTGLDAEDDLRVTGPMAAWVLPAEGDAKYLEFTGAGIEATRTAMRDQRDAALEAGARVMDSQAQESGDARRARQDDQHATLYGAVMQGAAGIEQMLKYLAVWAGANPDECVFRVKPEFTVAEVDAAMLQIVGNLNLAGKVPDSVLYESLRKAKLTDLNDDELAAQSEGGELVDDE